MNERELKIERDILEKHLISVYEDELTREEAYEAVQELLKLEKQRRVVAELEEENRVLRANAQHREKIIQELNQQIRRLSKRSGDLMDMDLSREDF